MKTFSKIKTNSMVKVQVLGVVIAAPQAQNYHFAKRASMTYG